MTDVKVEQCEPTVCGFVKATEAAHGRLRHLDISHG